MTQYASDVPPVQRINVELMIESIQCDLEFAKNAETQFRIYMGKQQKGQTATDQDIEEFAKIKELVKHTQNAIKQLKDIYRKKDAVVQILHPEAISERWVKM